MKTKQAGQFHKCANIACSREGGRILPGETIVIVGRDSLGRDKVICLTCNDTNGKINQRQVAKDKQARATIINQG